MAFAAVRPDLLYAWLGPSLLITNTRGECGSDQQLSGYYFREARHLRTLALTINGRPPWLCEAASSDPTSIALTFVYPEITQPGGGGTGQAGDEEGVDADGLPERSLDLRLTYRVRVASLDIDLTIANRALRPLTFDLAWDVDADFADIQEAQSNRREQTGDVVRSPGTRDVSFAYRHPELPLSTDVRHDGSFAAHDQRLQIRLTLAPAQEKQFTLRAVPHGIAGVMADDDARQREATIDRWRERFTGVETPGNRLFEEVMRRNIRDVASFPLLDGASDEWLALQAGMPLYPAFFGRDAVTAGWQAAAIDGGETLSAALTKLADSRADRFDDWRDEQPGRIPYQVRTGPLAMLNLNPYSAYYADYASPLMFVIALANLWAWTGERRRSTATTASLNASAATRAASRRCPARTPRQYAAALECRGVSADAANAPRPVAHGGHEHADDRSCAAGLAARSGPPQSAGRERDGVAAILAGERRLVFVGRAAPSGLAARRPAATAGVSHGDRRRPGGRGARVRLPLIAIDRSTRYLHDDSASSTRRTDHGHHRCVERHRTGHRQAGRRQGRARGAGGAQRRRSRTGGRGHPSAADAPSTSSPTSRTRPRSSGSRRPRSREFGRIDTWVNNAAVSMYGRVMQVPIEDMRRQMDVNYWGQVYGSRAAVRHLRERGGALINVGSALCDRAIPLQANYCAAKHALKGFTDALRMELEEEGVPISVTLVKPASIDTPFFEKARTYLGGDRSRYLPCTNPGRRLAGHSRRPRERPNRELIAGGSGAKLSAARFARAWPISTWSAGPSMHRVRTARERTARRSLRARDARRRRARPQLERSHAALECLYARVPAPAHGGRDLDRDRRDAGRRRRRRGPAPQLNPRLTRITRIRQGAVPQVLRSGTELAAIRETRGLL